MVKKIFFFILVLCLLFLPETIEACQWKTGLGCIGECNSGFTCQGDMSGCSCQPASGQPTNTPTPPCKSNGTTCTNHNNCCSGYCADNICANPPANTPPPCSNTGGFCNNTTTCCKTIDVCFGNRCVDKCDCVRGGNYCVNYCVDEGRADIWCYAADGCRNQCGNTLYNEWVGYVYCPQAGDESCHPATCHNAPDPEYCPNFDPNYGQCAGKGGNCDNCGGVDCGWCGGVPPGGNDPPPGCTPNCINSTISPCITTTCSDDTCQGNCGQYCYGAMYCPLTTLADFQIRRGSDWFYTDRNTTNGRDITDSQNRLHICDPFLTTESSQPRGLIYVARLANTLGCDNIDPNSVKMRWLGDNTEISMTKLAGYQDDRLVLDNPET